MARQYEYTYAVNGAGRFPIDMLRYDCCWPESQADSNAIDETRGQRVVHLVSVREPTDARWQSFGWRVNGKVHKR